MRFSIELKSKFFMTRIGKKIVFLSIICLQSFTLFSQDDLYRAEIGVQSGLGTYLGDVNSVARLDLLIKNKKNIKPDFGIEFRYRINPRIAFLLGYDYALIKGDYTYAYNRTTAIEKISNRVHFFDGWGEFNFFDLNTNRYKRFSKPIAPFVFVGLGGGIMPNNQGDVSKYCFTIPLGAGVKFKFKNRWNVNIKIVNRLLFSDNLEGIDRWNNPKPKTVSNGMNNDMYTALSVGLTYDFWEKGCDCKNKRGRKNKRKKR